MVEQTEHAEQCSTGRCLSERLHALAVVRDVGRRQVLVHQQRIGRAGMGDRDAVQRRAGLDEVQDLAHGPADLVVGIRRLTTAVPTGAGSVVVVSMIVARSPKASVSARASVSSARPA